MRLLWEQKLNDDWELFSGIRYCEGQINYWEKASLGALENSLHFMISFGNIGLMAENFIKKLLGTYKCYQLHLNSISFI